MPQQPHKGCCSPAYCQFKALFALKEYLSAQYITREEIGISKQSLFACWHFGIFLEGLAQNHDSLGSILSALALTTAQNLFFHVPQSLVSDPFRTQTHLAAIMRAAFAILLIAAAALSAVRAQSNLFPALLCATDTGLALLLTPPYARFYLGAAH
jgi:hypothetical protein